MSSSYYYFYDETPSAKASWRGQHLFGLHVHIPAHHWRKLEQELLTGQMMEASSQIHVWHLAWVGSVHLHHSPKKSIWGRCYHHFSEECSVPLTWYCQGERTEGSWGVTWIPQAFPSRPAIGQHNTGNHIYILLNNVSYLLASKIYYLMCENICLLLSESRRRCQVPRTAVTDGYRLPCGCWGPNLDPVRAVCALNCWAIF